MLLIHIMASASITRKKTVYNSVHYDFLITYSVSFDERCWCVLLVCKYMALYKRADTHSLWAPMKAWVDQCIFWLLCVGVCPGPLCSGLVLAGFAQSGSDPEQYWNSLEGKGWKVNDMAQETENVLKCVCLTDCYSLQPSVLPSVFPGLSPAQTSVMAMGGVSRARRRGRDAWRSSNRKIPLLYQQLVLNTF